jgi:malate dehydrogenase (oxaloacetate-decarboxylating)/malate dehydrogenase (oxaloacetate-decarboxylating)(NADP+)
MLYTLIGQVPPDMTLPVQLDMGTDRKEILADPLYHGWRHPRIRGAEHTKFVAEFVEAVKEVYGDTCLIQFEDFEMETAFRLLDHFRWRCNCFNDDIEGTASVTAASLASATHIKGVPDLKDQKVIFIGAGSAATGIANLIVDMAVSRGGITREQAFKNIHMFDAKGLVHKDRKDLFDFNKPFMHENVPGVKTPLDGVKKFKATAIIGVSGCPGLITKDIVEAMCENTEHPCIFPLSNPTSKAECTPHQAYTWSKGKCLCATGSPFPEEMVNGKKYITAQSNNSWIFPAVGFALVTTKARHCPGKVFEVAAEALASLVKKEDHDQHNLLPPLDKIRDYSFGIALKVAEYLIKEELATELPPKGVSLEAWMKPQLFNPTADYDKVY